MWKEQVEIVTARNARRIFIQKGTFISYDSFYLFGELNAYNYELNENIIWKTYTKVKKAN